MTEPKRQRIIKKEWNFFFGLLIAVAVIFGGALALSRSAIKNQIDHPLVMTATKLTGSSVAKINSTKIGYADFLDDKKALETFYATDESGAFGNVEDADLDRQVLSRLLSAALVGEVADEFDVKVSNEQLETAKAELIASFENEEAAAAEIQRRYGWNLDQFVKNVIAPVLLEQNVAEHFATAENLPESAQIEQIRASHILFQPKEGEEDEAVKARAQAVLDRIEAGEEFATLASEFGTDGTKDVGGDLGWFGRGAMVKPFEDAVFSLEDGQLSSDLVQTDFGFHIVQKTGERMTANFATYMDTQLSNASIEVYGDLPNPFAL